METIELTENNYAKYSRQIAEVHLAAYTKAHLTANFSLSQVEEYYQCLVMNSELSILAVDLNQEVDGSNCPRILGFIVAGSGVSRGVSRYMQGHRFYLMSVMLRNPRFIFQKLNYFLESKFGNIALSEAKFRLMSITVRPEVQSAGVGREMLFYFEKILMDRGVHCYGLSVKSENFQAVSFYERNGFVLEKNVSGSRYYKKQLVA